jgi:hypothetical protein
MRSNACTYNLGAPYLQRPGCRLMLLTHPVVMHLLIVSHNPDCGRIHKRGIAMGMCASNVALYAYTGMLIDNL